MSNSNNQIQTAAISIVTHSRGPIILLGNLVNIDTSTASRNIQLVQLNLKVLFIGGSTCGQASCSCRHTSSILCKISLLRNAPITSRLSCNIRVLLNCADIGNVKLKLLKRSFTILYLIIFGQFQFTVQINGSHVGERVPNIVRRIITLGRKRCGCADGEHHGGSQNAREEFLQFHCNSSLVRNSSYSCAAAQTPRFTGRMPAASSGLRGITDCVAAVV